MLNIGMTELLAFGIIALLVLGPEKLPEAARFAGRWYGKIKRMVSNVQADLDRELRLSELREQMQQEMARIQELEQKMQAQMHELQQQKNFADNALQEHANTHNKNLSTQYFFIEQAPPLVLTRQPERLACFCQITEQPESPVQSSYPELKVAV
ncbi:Sec-independent protein translocase protein TatB [Acinetobacter radioresistens]|jgi:sec-independent protein translocase protein TatB|uniref:Sec-independent protein translocase protein TatB n=1 Tax=Acinetobacter TaxID=469 RepID=UPI0001BBB347|nr:MULTISPECIES: Sec-independent protein translocase protein TatB [Acinetobacter]EEY86251.1 twin arginine-targeting protein translocase TatB [Acinetobacter radioresistens SH164]ENV87246.1 twin arginine-targeting protein translocase TatB [Acinetobacter radioresistens NIPH 2130]EXB88001.1 twin arginine-targeting protein translocase TatB [Acinetobacter sp. 272263]KCX38244.1 twin arginine-targeting protein translocase TatB [Acinetobacter sp. 263903-1]MBA5695853.1 twin-arginine translocase subunit 